jgi:hypothetical protein
VDPISLATVFVGSFEGALMICRLERKPDALLAARSHQDHYLDKQIKK